MSKAGRFGKYGEVKRMGRTLSRKDPSRDRDAKKIGTAKRRKKKTP